MLIVEDTANRFYFVAENTDPNLSHVWKGIRVKRSKGGFVAVANAKPELVRKAGCKIIQGAVA